MNQIFRFSAGVPTPASPLTQIQLSGNIFKTLRRGAILLFVFSLGLTCARAALNLLENGSFERWSAGAIPVSWTNAFPGGTPSLTTNVLTRSGKYVVQITDTNAAQPAGILSDSIAVAPGETFTASASLLRTNNSVAFVELKFFDVAETELAAFQDVATNIPGSWENLSVTATAPPSAATARVLCASSAASVGTFYFDGIALVQTVSPPINLIVKYVAPSGSGTASGSSPANAAKYNQSSFWTAVKSDLQTRPVKVVFLQGEYLINTSSDRLLLTNIGRTQNQLTLEGELPWGTVFTRNNSASPGTIDSGAFTMVQLQYATNVALRHLHWETDITQTGKQSSYSLVINSAASGAQTTNITVESCTFVGLNWNIYGAMGIHHLQTRNVRVARCEFIQGGFNSGFHMIYNAYGASDLKFENNYFQDCSGAYLRLRAGCHDTLVRSNEFVSTGSFYNQPFLQLATFNDVMPGDETWGYNHVLSNNDFNYLTSGANVAMHLYHSGFDPVREPGLLWDYLLTTDEAAVLNSGTVATKKALIAKNFGLGFGTNLLVFSNTHQGFHSYKLKLESRSNYTYTNSQGVVYVCPNYGGNGAYDISSLIAPPASPVPLAFTRSGDFLNFIWPATHQGWLLQTNATGLAVSPGWIDIPGSDTVTNLNLPLSSAANVFFRLRSP